MPDKEASAKAQELLKEKIADTDSVGGIIECVVKNMPPELVNLYLKNLMQI